ncbi:uncharacterized protein LOC129916586 [Episyrphus balteatus]|uniref:uncharacterized protein LOC129916586 n=1 Tax=Episyrphus balteatus TaxID=286459 RepID=UPI0024861EC6|nr:uncharacterized protein LOC129916586 [Episyrphus balteatus]
MYCCVNSCKSSYYGHSDILTFHRLPTSLWRKEKWIDILKLDRKQITPNSVVCSNHFHKSDFIEGSKNPKKRLFPSALPFLLENYEKPDELMIPSNGFDDDDTDDDPQFNEIVFVEGVEEVSLPPPRTNVIEEVPMQEPPMIEWIDNTKPQKRPLHSSDDDIPSSSNLLVPLVKKNKQGIPVRQISSKRVKMKEQTNNVENKKVKKKLKKIASLNEIMSNLKKENLINEETLDILQTIRGTNKILFQTKLNIIKASPTFEKEYQQVLRSCALHLNYLSPKAYDFVRDNFDCFLPESDTISEWYQRSDYNSGFAKDALDVIKIAVTEAAYKSKKVILNLVLDDMIIEKSPGYTFNDDRDDFSIESTRILVLFVVCVNQNWKIPIGYFPMRYLDATQQSNLVKLCMESILKTGAEILGLSLLGDGESVLIAKLLGANLKDLNADNNNTFTVDASENRVCIIPDPCFMIQLITISFAKRGSFKDINRQLISWHYIDELRKIQKRNNNEELAKILDNTKLDDCVLSKSVAKAIDFCRDVLLLAQFCDSEATAYFINNLYNILDFLNGKSESFGKASSNENTENVLKYATDQIDYLSKLISIDGIRIIKQTNSFGFIGLINCLKNIKVIYERFIKNKLLDSLVFYKLNKDQIEQFFDSIRSQVGCYNPTVRQFKLVYKKHILRCKIRQASIGDSFSLDNVQFLNLSFSNPFESKKFEGSHQNMLHYIVDTSQEENETFLNDHDYFMEADILNEFTCHVVENIARFVIFKLEKLLSCTRCKKYLFTIKSFNTFNAYAKKGYRKLPSRDVICICSIAETQLRIQSRIFHKQEQISTQNIYNRIVINSLNELIGKTIFDGHVRNSGHFVAMAKIIIEFYLKTRNYYITSRRNNTFIPVTNNVSL